jgi:hypothetical protein
MLYWAGDACGGNIATSGSGRVLRYGFVGGWVLGQTDCHVGPDAASPAAWLVVVVMVECHNMGLWVCFWVSVAVMWGHMLHLSAASCVGRPPCQSRLCPHMGLQRDESMWWEGGQLVHNTACCVVFCFVEAVDLTAGCTGMGGQSIHADNQYKWWPLWLACRCTGCIDHVYMCCAAVALQLAECSDACGKQQITQQGAEAWVGKAVLGVYSACCARRISLDQEGGWG